MWSRRRFGIMAYVHVTGARSRPAVGWALHLLFVLAAWGAAACVPARADVSVLDGAVAPVIRVNVREGDVTIRTWDREAVQIDADPSVVVERKPFRAPASLGSLPIAAAGRAGSDTFLPPESFVPGPVPPGPRDSIFVHSDADTLAGPVTVTIPSDAPLVFAIARGGSLRVEGYRSGTLVAYTTSGRLSLADSGGTVFAQSGRGPIVVSDSSFDRIRARSLQGNITFERCAVHQIETTSVAGSIVFDGGSFEPGLARFESVRGDVAIGSEAAAEITARSSTGRAYSSFLNHASVDEREGTSHVTIAGGGPVVTAASGSGNVYLYDGSLRNRALPPEWHAPTETLERPGMRRMPSGNPFARFRSDAPRKYRLTNYPRRPYPR
jgi:hypothetical protein